MNHDWEQRQRERWERRQERRDARGGIYGPNPLGGVVFGLILIGGGLMFLLRNLGVIYFENIWQYWPVILIVIGASKVAAPRHPGQILPGVILIGVGVIFLLRTLGIIYGNIWGYIWPAFFICIGVSMLMRNLYGPNAGVGDSGIIDESGSSENVLKADVVFGGIQKRVQSQAFEGGSVTVFFGGANIDLRGAAVQRPEIVVNADVVFGGVELKVPETWQVEVRGSGFFGGYDDRTHRPAPNVAGPNLPRVIVRGSALFGGVTVRN